MLSNLFLEYYIFNMKQEVYDFEGGGIHGMPLLEIL